MNTRYWLFILLIVISLGHSAWAHEQEVPLQEAQVDTTDQATLQRGARLFMNYCAGCHSLRYLRYSTLAQDLGLLNEDDTIAKDLVVNNLIFTQAKITDPVDVALLPEDAKIWFGVAPPDLTLEAKVRGADWIYTYLLSFYNDPSKPFRTNNWLYPDVAMPNVLAPLQGEQIAVYQIHQMMIEGKSQSEKTISYLQLINQGSMTPQEFQSAMNDIVNFLVYAAEPQTAYREYLGYWVLGFLLILLVLTYLLKRAYWQDID